MKKASRLFATGTDFGGVMSGPWVERSCHPERSEGSFLWPKRSLAALGMTFAQFVSLVQVGDHAVAYLSFEDFCVVAGNAALIGANLEGTSP
jgi:hypothetical protein